MGALDGGSPMSHVDFKKWSFPCHYFRNFHVDFKMVPYPMSILRTTHVVSLIQFPHVARLHVTCRFKKWTFRGQEPLCGHVTTLGESPREDHTVTSQFRF